MTDYVDDIEVKNDWCLWRRIPPLIDWVIWDDNQGRYRPSSMAFQDCPDGDPMSMYVEERLLEANLEVRSILAGYEGWYAAKLIAQMLRNNRQIIHRDDTDPPDPGHVLVVGPKKKEPSRWAKNAEFLNTPEELPKAYSLKELA